MDAVYPLKVIAVTGVRSAPPPPVDPQILRRVRATIGPDIPLVISLDYHANVTPRMVELMPVGGATSIGAIGQAAFEPVQTGRPAEFTLAESVRLALALIRRSLEAARATPDAHLSAHQFQSYTHPDSFRDSVWLTKSASSGTMLATG